MEEQEERGRRRIAGTFGLCSPPDVIEGELESETEQPLGMASLYSKSCIVVDDSHRVSMLGETEPISSPFRGFAEYSRSSLNTLYRPTDRPCLKSI